MNIAASPILVDLLVDRRVRYRGPAGRPGLGCAAQRRRAAHLRKPPSVSTKRDRASWMMIRNRKDPEIGAGCTKVAKEFCDHFLFALVFFCGSIVFPDMANLAVEIYDPCEIRRRHPWAMT
ncbi:MAG: hypothetical protein M1457_13450 [bacterium]|nr:hypothetical protein [bacterium]